jgi:hypothetical protein
MRITNELECYEINGEEQKGIDLPILKVSSHWNRDEFVVLEFNGQKITVVISQLSKAIQNAGNWSRS